MLWLKLFLFVAGGWTRWPWKVSSNPNHPMVYLVSKSSMIWGILHLLMLHVSYRHHLSNIDGIPAWHCSITSACLFLRSLVNLKCPCQPHNSTKGWIKKIKGCWTETQLKRQVYPSLFFGRSLLLEILLQDRSKSYLRDSPSQEHLLNCRHATKLDLESQNSNPDVEKWRNGFAFFFKILGLIKEEALTAETLIQKASGWRVSVEKIKIKWV